MNTEKINEQIIISKKIYDCYLLYAIKEYYLFVPENDSYRDVKIDIGMPPNVVSDLINPLGHTNISDDSTINEGLLLIMQNLEEIGKSIEDQYDFLLESFGDLDFIIHGEEDIDERFANITDENIINKIEEISKTPIYEDNKLEITEQYTQFKGHDHYRDGLYLKEVKADNETKYIFKGNILINYFILTYDKLGLFPPVVTISFTNTKINKDTLLTKIPFSDVATEIYNQQIIDSNIQGIENILRKINVHGKTPIANATEDIFKDGFFFDANNNKVLSKNIFNDLNPTTEDIKEAITLFNKLIENRGTAIPNDCTLFRFMLWSPFSFCIKTLGFQEALYGIVLWGQTNTNKTGSATMFSYLYTDKDTTLQKANTQSAIGTRLGENTFPLILDEAKDNLTNPDDEEFNKNIGGLLWHL